MVNYNKRPKRKKKKENRGNLIKKEVVMEASLKKLDLSQQ